MVIYGLNFSFKVQFVRVSRRVNWIFFLVDPFFFMLQMIVYQIALIPRKLSCHKEILGYMPHCSKFKLQYILNVPYQSIYFMDRFTFHAGQYQAVLTYRIQQLKDAVLLNFVWRFMLIRFMFMTTLLVYIYSTLFSNWDRKQLIERN